MLKYGAKNMNIYKSLKQLLDLLLDIKNDMKSIHNIEYSTAYIKLNKVIAAIDNIIKFQPKPIRKFGIFSKSSK
tara:strand:- start:555 stop:776 length:222 start_codon:yes stop_codon:yes gene_type:complete